MQLLELYDEIYKYFTEGKQKDSNANEIQIEENDLILIMTPRKTG